MFIAVMESMFTYVEVDNISFSYTNSKEKYCHVTKRWWITGMKWQLWHLRIKPFERGNTVCAWPSECYFFCFVYQSSLLLDWIVNTLFALNAHRAINTLLLSKYFVSNTHKKTKLFSWFKSGTYQQLLRYPSIPSHMDGVVLLLPVPLLSVPVEWQ